MLATITLVVVTISLILPKDLMFVNSLKIVRFSLNMYGRDVLLSLLQMKKPSG